VKLRAFGQEKTAKHSSHVPRDGEKRFDDRHQDVGLPPKPRFRPSGISRGLFIIAVKKLRELVGCSLKSRFDFAASASRRQYNCGTFRGNRLEIS
jgi:hypothetical protein